MVIGKRRSEHAVCSHYICDVPRDDTVGAVPFKNKTVMAGFLPIGSEYSRELFRSVFSVR
ncbi:hypothetical protein D3C72_2171350 [compost metagenome]